MAQIEVPLFFVPSSRKESINDVLYPVVAAFRVKKWYHTRTMPFDCSRDGNRTTVRPFSSLAKLLLTASLSCAKIEAQTPKFHVMQSFITCTTVTIILIIDFLLQKEITNDDAVARSRGIHFWRLSIQIISLF